MKGLAQQNRSAVGRPIRRTVSHIQTKPRTGAGNRHRQKSDHFERQADEAAYRFLRGDHNLAATLTPTTAASFLTPSSPGEQLPMMLRVELEESFGADLSAVRIHRDPYAAEEVRLQHATAFTSGRDVF